MRRRPGATRPVQARSIAGNALVPPSACTPSIHFIARSMFARVAATGSASNVSKPVSNAMISKVSLSESPSSAARRARRAATIRLSCIDPERSSTNTASRGHSSSGLRVAGGSTTTSVRSPSVYARTVASWARDHARTTMSPVQVAEPSTRSANESFTAAERTSGTDAAMSVVPAGSVSSSSSAVPSPIFKGGVRRDASGARSVSGSTPSPS